VKNVVIEVKHIVNFVTKKLKMLAIYKTFKDLELLKFFKIRYAYMMFIILERFLKAYLTLEKMIICDVW
jgi:hypothetical protein